MNRIEPKLILLFLSNSKVDGMLTNHHGFLTPAGGGNFLCVMSKGNAAIFVPHSWEEMQQFCAKALILM